MNAGRKVQRAAGYLQRSKNAAHNCAVVPERTIAAKPRFPLTESEARGVYAAFEKAHQCLMAAYLKAHCPEDSLGFKAIGETTEGCLC